MRTFIAIDLDPPLKEALQALVSDLAPLAPNIRWVRAEGMHLTLKFLGETSDDKAAAVVSALKEISGGSPRFPIRLKGVGTFPPGGRVPRVVWVGIDAGPQLAALNLRIESAAAGLGFEPETRAFHPHLTLGRVKFTGRMDRLLQEMDRLQGNDFGEMEVGRLTYFRSVLAPEGAVYSILGEFQLS